MSQKTHPDNKSSPSDIEEMKSKLRSQAQFLENLERLDSAIMTVSDVDEMLKRTLETVLEIFDCDRAWLLYPCDPSAASWHVHMEAAKPEYPGAFTAGQDMPMTDDAAEAMSAVLEHKEPVYGSLAAGEPSWDPEDKYGVRAYMLTAVYPRTGKPWEFGLHQCSRSRKWTKEEVSLFKKIAIRLGDALGIFLTISDLQKSQERFSLAQQVGNIGSWDLDITEGRLHWSEQMEPMFGLVHGSFAGTFGAFLDLVHPDDRQEVTARIDDCVETGKNFSFEHRIIRPDGQLRWIEQTGNLFRDKEGKPLKLLGINQDITRRKQAEEKQYAHIRFLENLEQIDLVIRKSADTEQMLRDVLNKVLTMFDCDRSWLLYPCDPAQPSFRVPMEVCKPEYPGAMQLDLEIPMRPGADIVLSMALENDSPVMFSHELLDEIYKDLKVRFDVKSQIVIALYPQIGKPWLFGMHQCSYNREWNEDDARLFTEIGRRLTDGLSTMLSLEESREYAEKLRSTINSMDDLIFVLDESGNFIEYHKPQTLTDQFSLPEQIIGSNVEKIFPAGIAALFLEGISQLKETGDVQKFDYCVELHQSGTWYSASMSQRLDKGGVFAGATVVCRDITEAILAAREKEELEERLRQSQKLETIGQLVGAVAHDLNNLLSPILGYSDLMLMSKSKDDKEHLFLKEITKAANLAKKLNSQLLAFGRKQLLNMRIIDVNQTIKELEPLLKSSIRENITLQMRYASDGGLIKADSSQVEQILLNLAVNAQDAMPDGGKLTIQTESTVMDQDFADRHPGTAAGKYLLLTVADTGDGIEKQHQQHIFEPFFTTKPKGKGTGLGLATVYGIVKQHGGSIWMYSEKGMGTVFKIYFPVVQEGADDVHVEVEFSGDLSGQETIMITEDNPGVLEFVSTSLKTLGYRVLTSTNGDECIEAFETAGSIDLLITDLVMPGMNGRELYRKLLQKSPNLEVIFISGYTADTVSSEEMTNNLCIVNKPFTLSVLGQEIRKVLGNNRKGDTY